MYHTKNKVGTASCERRHFQRSRRPSNGNNSRFRVFNLEFLIIQQFSALPLEKDSPGFLSQLLKQHFIFCWKLQIKQIIISRVGFTSVHHHLAKLHTIGDKRFIQECNRRGNAFQQLCILHKCAFVTIIIVCGYDTL